MSTSTLLPNSYSNQDLLSPNQQNDNTQCSAIFSISNVNSPNSSDPPISNIKSPTTEATKKIRFSSSPCFDLLINDSDLNYSSNNNDNKKHGSLCEQNNDQEIIPKVISSPVCLAQVLSTTGKSSLPVFVPNKHLNINSNVSNVKRSKTSTHIKNVTSPSQNKYRTFPYQINSTIPSPQKFMQYNINVSSYPYYYIPPLHQGPGYITYPNSQTSYYSTKQTLGIVPSLQLPQAKVYNPHQKQNLIQKQNNKKKWENDIASVVSENSYKTSDNSSYFELKSLSHETERKGYFPKVDYSDATRWETDSHKIRQRAKQIQYGKNTKEYIRYLELVPKKRRIRGTDPSTPNPHWKCSKKKFDTILRSWRKKLHQYDPPEDCKNENEVELKNISLSVVNNVVGNTVGELKVQNDEEVTLDGRETETKMDESENEEVCSGDDLGEFDCEEDNSSYNSHDVQEKKVFSISNSCNGRDENERSKISQVQQSVRPLYNENVCMANSPVERLLFNSEDHPHYSFFSNSNSTKSIFAFPTPLFPINNDSNLQNEESDKQNSARSLTEKLAHSNFSAFISSFKTSTMDDSVSGSFEKGDNSHLNSSLRDSLNTFETSSISTYSPRGRRLSSSSFFDMCLNPPELSSPLLLNTENTEQPVVSHVNMATLTVSDKASLPFIRSPPISFPFSPISFPQLTPSPFHLFTSSSPVLPSLLQDSNKDDFNRNLDKFFPENFT